MDLIAIKYEHEKEGVKSIMSGKILDFEAKRINDSAEARGVAKTANLMAKLATLLARDGRIDEIERASTDEVFRNSLYKEYQLA